MATPPRLTQLRCPMCAACHWVIDHDFRTEGGDDVSYADRQYRCPHCACEHTGYVVVRQSSPSFLMNPHTASRAEHEEFYPVLKRWFPTHPALSVLESINLAALDALDARLAALKKKLAGGNAS